MIGATSQVTRSWQPDHVCDRAPDSVKLAVEIGGFRAHDGRGIAKIGHLTLDQEIEGSNPSSPAIIPCSGHGPTSDGHPPITAPGLLRPRTPTTSSRVGIGLAGSDRGQRPVEEADPVPPHDVLDVRLGPATGAQDVGDLVVVDDGVDPVRRALPAALTVRVAADP